MVHFTKGKRLKWKERSELSEWKWKFKKENKEIYYKKEERDTRRMAQQHCRGCDSPIPQRESLS